MRQDSVITIISDTSTYRFKPDTTRLTCEFMRGNWKVISTDEDSSIKTTIEFNSRISDEKVGNMKFHRKSVLVRTDEWRLKVQPTSELNLYNFASQDESIKLKISRAGNRTKGELKLRYKVGIVEKKEVLKTYQLLFTKV